jgi:hypothetical protein
MVAPDVLSGGAAEAPFAEQRANQAAMGKYRATGTTPPVSIGINQYGLGQSKVEDATKRAAIDALDELERRRGS